MRVEERLRLLVLQDDGVEIANFYNRRIESALRRFASQGSVNVPSEFIVMGESMSVCWNAGDMKSSPVPVFVRTAKCTQNQKR